MEEKIIEISKITHDEELEKILQKYPLEEGYDITVVPIDATREKMGDIVPVEISIYDDRSFDFVLKTPPTPTLLKKAAGTEYLSGWQAGQLE